MELKVTTLEGKAAGDVDQRIQPAEMRRRGIDRLAGLRRVGEVDAAGTSPLYERVAVALSESDEALRAIHLAESESERRRALERLAFDEAVGLQWALVARRHGELSESGPPAPPQPPQPQP